MLPSKRVRKANFSESEVSILLEEISIEFMILSGSHSATVTQQRKNEIWTGIAGKVSACGVAQRTAQECKDKWRAMKGAVLNKQRDNKKTGGGPPVPPAPYEDLILGIIGYNTFLISGINVEGTSPTCGSQDAQPGCSEWPDGSKHHPNSCPQLPSVVTLPPLPDDTGVVYAEVNYDDGSVDISLDANLSTSQQPVAGHLQLTSGAKQSKCGKRKANFVVNKSWSKKEKRLGELPLIQVKDNDELVEEWLRSEISKNKKKERKADLEIMKLELELGNSRETSVPT